MSKAQLNDRGQITIPKKIRDKVNLKPNETVNIDIMITIKLSFPKGTYLMSLTI